MAPHSVLQVGEEAEANELKRQALRARALQAKGQLAGRGGRGGAQGAGPRLPAKKGGSSSTGASTQRAGGRRV